MVHVWQFRSRKRCSALDNSVSCAETMTIKEHDCVVLTADLPSERLKPGEVGTVIHIHTQVRLMKSSS